MDPIWTKSHSIHGEVHTYIDPKEIRFLSIRSCHLGQIEQRVMMTCSGSKEGLGPLFEFEVPPMSGKLSPELR